MAMKEEYRTNSVFLAAFIWLALGVEPDWHITRDSKVFFVFSPVEGLRAAVRDFYNDKPVHAGLYAIRIAWLNKMRQRLKKICKIK